MKLFRKQYPETKIILVVYDYEKAMISSEHYDYIIGISEFEKFLKEFFVNKNGGVQHAEYARV